MGYINWKNHGAAVVIVVIILSILPMHAAWSWWQPTGQWHWDIQLTGELNLDPSADAVDVDVFDTPIETIQALKAQGVKVICYLSAGSFEDWRPDASQFPESVKGSSNGWAGENWLDIRQTKILKPIMSARMDLAVEKGCDAIDADNVDGFTNDTGFPLKASQQLTYNRMLANLAHTRELAIGLKNDLLQTRQLVSTFDFAINESCLAYDECDLLQPFTTVGKPVLAIDYDNGTEICEAANALGFSLILKDDLLSMPGTSCF